MKLSGLMVLPLVLGLSAMTVACDAGGDREVDEQQETESRESESMQDEDGDDEEESDDNDDD